MTRKKSLRRIGRWIGKTHRYPINCTAAYQRCPAYRRCAFNTREKGRTSKSQPGGAWSFPMVCIRAYSILSIRFKRGKRLSPIRRFVPSGGALYPNEIYVYVNLEDVPKGIYHYDVAHHRLVLVREGNYDFYLSRSLENGYHIPDCFCTIFVSTVFWKNFYKYNNFSYRLQGLDAGVLIGQSLEVANRMGFSSRVCYQFLDRCNQSFAWAVRTG